ncbi:MAG: metallophosphoesterase [Acidimicrobiales bacterium]
MPDIRYVCLSDLHFGAESSILTCLDRARLEPDPHQTSTVMHALVDGLAGLIGANEGTQKPRLILCGDILELALATDNIAAMVFERFIELVFTKEGRLFDDTVYFVPGNHDHHLWEAARERQYADYVRRRPLDEDLEIPWHTSRMMTEDDQHPVEAELLTALVQRRPHLQGVTVRAVYPNLALRTEDNSRGLVIHHGHFVESMYRLMSRLKDLAFPGRPTPQQVWEWESENFAWIDFFWSTLGRSGEVGEDVGLIYASMNSERKMEELAHNLAMGIAEKRNRPQPLQWLEGKGLDLVLKQVVKRVGNLERSSPSAPSAKVLHGLRSYIGGPVLNQLHAEYDGKELPDRLTFVFGHTHKPFQLALDQPGFRRPVEVYNTGGWVVDSPKTLPLQGGAAILVDEGLNAVSLRLYNQSDDPSNYRVQLATLGNAGTNPLFARLNERIDPERDPWSRLSQEAAKLVAERHEELATFLGEGTSPPH